MSSHAVNSRTEIPENFDLLLAKLQSVYHTASNSLKRRLIAYGTKRLYTECIYRKKLPEFLKKVQEGLKEIVREGVLSLVAKSAERLYDMKFVEGLKYETSIFDQAVGMVSGKISGVALGAFHDDRFDFRASLIIAKPKDENSQYVLLNTENFLIQHYWDELPEVQSYKFDAAVAGTIRAMKENAEHGRIWHDIFEDAGWNIHLTGYAAQLSVQPKVEDMNISPMN